MTTVQLLTLVIIPKVNVFVAVCRWLFVVWALVFRRSRKARRWGGSANSRTRFRPAVSTGVPAHSSSSRFRWQWWCGDSDQRFRRAVGVAFRAMGSFSTQPLTLLEAVGKISTFVSWSRLPTTGVFDKRLINYNYTGAAALIDHFDLRSS
jgi:hypothetical protein